MNAMNDISKVFYIIHKYSKHVPKNAENILEMSDNFDNLFYLVSLYPIGILEFFSIIS